MTSQNLPALPSQRSYTAVSYAVDLWAQSTSDATSGRYADLVRDKRKMLANPGDPGRPGFFDYCQKSPELVTEIDVKAWQAALEDRDLSPSTIYGYISRLSSFYEWAMQDPALASAIRRNPVTLARPKAPKAYSSEKTKALTNDELRALLGVVKAKADAGELVGLRDYALLLSYALTGYRRQEVIRWRGTDVKLNGKMLVTTREKGGDLRTREVNDLVRTAVRAYLLASGRDPQDLAPDQHIWLSHDRAYAGTALTSHGFAKNFKRYARQAGLGDVHLHMLRHTYAGMVYEATGGDVGAAQYELGHKSQQTTKIYLHTVAVRKDRYSSLVASNLGL